jgi:alanine racemase
MIHLTDLLAATGGRLIGQAGATAFESFCYDSRLARPGQLFVAVKTDHGDGHDYIGHALAGGATGVLCQTPPALRAGGATCVVVPDTRQALQAWARAILARQAVKIIGVTGSVGKTTAKEAIATALAGQFPIFRNRANYNGLYGLPIALGELRPEHRVAVLEMAADHCGEMARLCEIAPPHIAVVTTVEPAHLETFGSLDAIAREKGALVAALPPGGLAVLNADDPRVAAMRDYTTARVLTFGACEPRPGAAAPDIVARNITVTREGLRFDVETPVGRDHVHFPLLGRHQVYAALAAIAVGLACEMPLAAILARLADMPRIPGRLNPLEGRRGSLLLDDTYSSSPAAAEAALETLAALEGRRKIAVLGDMLELGAAETAGHAQVGRAAARLADCLVTKGARGRLIAEAARAAGMDAGQVVITYTAEDAARAVLERVGPGDVILVKGSLATRMEQVARLLLEDGTAAGDVLVRQDAAWQQIVTVRPDRPTWLEIDLGAIAHNVRRLKKLAGASQLMISLKADAYGHGAIQVAQTALHNGAAWLGVACLSEGIALRQAGITAPILILGFTPAWQARDALRHGLTATIFDLAVAEAFSRAALALDRPARLHVKVDTGMGRLGIFPAEVVPFVKALRELPGVIVEGIFTHLSVADGASEWEEGYTGDQLAAFDRALADLRAAGIVIPLAHALNSAGVLQEARGRRQGSGVRGQGAGDRRAACEQGSGWGCAVEGQGTGVHVGRDLSVQPLYGTADENQAHGGGGFSRSGDLSERPAEASKDQQTLVRCGIAVYGLDPSPQVRCPTDFRPALAWKTQVAQVKDLPVGSHIGYGATYCTPGPERIAVIPVGYADGFRRGPRHWGEALVRGRRAPIVGRVCMDQTMLNVTRIPGVRLGDEVVLIGAQGMDRISAEEVAERLGTINYEVVSAILARVPRETIA